MTRTRRCKKHERRRLSLPRHIPDDLYAQICEGNDIIEYVSRYTNLKKSGRDYSGLCPFHTEKTPSFHVNREKQLFYCFGCGASGNLVQFVMRTENLSYWDAMQTLADHAGIALPEHGSFNDENSEKRKLILEMNKISAHFFHNCLKNAELGKTAREYLQNRRIAWGTVIKYGLGYAPPSNAGFPLCAFLRKKGYTDEQIKDASLGVERDGTLKDKFRDRVIFPIIDVRGNVIGFGGRVMHNKKEINGFSIPKYLNSSETAAFDKGRNLYSLNIAKNAKASELILCEGYMDVISTCQAGVTNVVATLGTAITENQAKLMLRYAPTIIICYDSDEAGTKAALKAINIINSAGGKSRVMRLKGAKDPDEYIVKNGAAAFRDAIKKAVPSTEFKISLIRSKYDTTDTDGKIKFVTEAAESLRSVPDAVEVDAYIRKLSEETGISTDAIYSSYNKKQSDTDDSHKRIAPKRRPVQTRESGDMTTPALAAAEKRILSLMASSKHLYRIVSAELKSGDFSTEVHRRLAKAIYDCYERGALPDEAAIVDEFSGDTQLENEASAVFYNMEIYSGDESAVRELLYNIKLEHLQMKINSETDLIKLDEFMKEKERLLSERNQWEE